MKKTFILFLILCLAAPGVKDLNAQIKVGTTAAQFLKIGVGCRAEAMGGAFVATADDASALYWNPAGICRIQNNEAFFMHAEWLAQTKFDYVGAIFGIGDYAKVGLSLTSLSMDDEKVRTVFEPNGTGEYFQAGDFAMALTFGRNLTDRFSFGITMKYIQQKIWKTTSSAFAFDVGTLFDTQLKGLRIGMSMSNFGSKMQMTGDNLLMFVDLDPTVPGETDRVKANLQTEKWDMPLNFRLGLAYDIISNNYHYLAAELDAVHPNDLDEYLNIGAEYGFLYSFPVFIRGGYHKLGASENQGGFAFGAGTKVKIGTYVELKLDYSYTDWGILDEVQRFSLGICF